MTIKFIKYGMERKCMEKENITKLTDEEKSKAEKNFLQSVHDTFGKGKLKPSQYSALGLAYIGDTILLSL